MPWSVSVVMTQLLPLYTGQGPLNLSETPRRRPGCGETRTRVSPLPSQCFCHDLIPPGSSRPQEVGARSLIDSTGNSEWSSAALGARGERALPAGVWLPAPASPCSPPPRLRRARRLCSPAPCRQGEPGPLVLACRPPSSPPPEPGGVSVTAHLTLSAWGGFSPRFCQPRSHPGRFSDVS